MEQAEKLDLIATGMWSYNGHPLVSALAASLGGAASSSDAADVPRLQAFAAMLSSLWEYEDMRLRGWSYLGPLDLLGMLEAAAERGGCEQELEDAFTAAAKRKVELQPEDYYVPDPEHVRMIEWELDECPWCEAEIPTPPRTRESMLGLELEDPSIGKCIACSGELQTAEALILRIFARGRKEGIEPRPLREYMEGGDPQWCVVGSVLVTNGQPIDNPVITHSMREDGSLVCSVLQTDGDYVDNFCINSADSEAPFHIISVPREVEGEATAVAAQFLKDRT